MSNSFRSGIVRPLALAFFLAGLSACASGPKVETQTFETPDGAYVVQSVEMVATVEAVDARTRTVRLKPKHGDAKTFTAHDRVANFSQIQVGDEVHAKVVDELAITLIHGGASESIGAAGAVAVSPLGAKPGIIMVDTMETTGKIVGIDAHHHSLTIELIDGSTRTIKVGKHRDLETVKLGDAIRARLTEGVAIAVVSPPAK